MERGEGAQHGHPIALLGALFIVAVILLWFGTGSVAPGGNNNTHLAPVGSMGCTFPGNYSSPDWCVVPGGVTTQFNQMYVYLTIFGGVFAVAAIAGLIIWWVEKN